MGNSGPPGTWLLEWTEREREEMKEGGKEEER